MSARVSGSRVFKSKESIRIENMISRILRSLLQQLGPSFDSLKSKNRMEKKLVDGFNAAFKEMKLVRMEIINSTIKKLHLLEVDLSHIVIEKAGKFE